MERFKRKAVPAAFDASLSSHSRLKTAPLASDHVAQPARYAVVREVLLRYLSPVLVDSVLERALKTRRLSAASLSGVQLLELASDAMVGLRLFVPEERLAQLMLDLADALEVRE